MNRIDKYIKACECFHASTEDSLRALFVELTEDIGMDEGDALRLIGKMWDMVANEYGE